MIQVLKKNITLFFLILIISSLFSHPLVASNIRSKNDTPLTLDDVAVFNLLPLSEVAKLNLRSFHATIYLEITNTKEGCALVKTMIHRSSKGKRRSLFYDILQKMHRGIITIEKEYRSQWVDLGESYAETYLKRSLFQLTAYKNRLDLFRTGNITFKNTIRRREDDEQK